MKSGVAWEALMSFWAQGMVVEKASGEAQIMANTGYGDNFIATICKAAWRFLSEPPPVNKSVLYQPRSSLFG
jgi:hypothetical protein